MQAVLEAELVTRGFREAKSLATILQEFIDSVKYSLPDKPRNKIGMAFAKSVIIHATELIKEDESIKEVEGIAKSIQIKIWKQCSGTEQQILKDIFSMMFPDLTPGPVYDQLSLAVTLEKNSCEHTPDSLTQFSGLYDSIRSNTVTLVYGTICTGKSTAIKQLRQYIENLKSAAPKKCINIFEVDPLLIGEDELYMIKSSKNEEPKTMESILYKLLASTSQGTETWIVFQSCSNSCTWVKNLLARISLQTHTFYFNTNDRISIATGVKFILKLSCGFESISTREIMKCAIVFFDDVLNLNLTYIGKWIKQLEKSHRKIIGFCIEKCLIPIMAELSLSDHIAPIRSRIFTVLAETFMKIEISLSRGSISSEQLKISFCRAVLWSFDVSTNERALLHIKNLLQFTDDDINCRLKLLKTGFNVPNTFIEDIKRITNNNGIILTVNLLSAVFIAKTLMDSSIPLVIAGVSGTGKSTLLHILSNLKQEQAMTVDITYNKYTSISQIVKSIKSKVQRVKPNLFWGKKQKLIFIVDNLNCSEMEHLNTVMGFVKSCNNQKEIFNKDKQSFDEIQDNTFIFGFQLEIRSPVVSLSDSPLQWGKGAVHVLELETFSQKELEIIFQKMFEQTFVGIDQSVKTLKNQLASFFVDFLFTLRKFELEENEQLFSSRTHSNIHDLRSIFHAMSMVNQNLLDKDSFLSLFIHECDRIFGDSTVIPRAKFWELIKMKMEHYFYGDMLKEFFLTGKVIYQIKNLFYTEIKIEDFQNDLSSITNHPPSLTLFQSLCQHVARIIRALSITNHTEDSINRLTPYNVILIGPNGVGKLTSALLATKYCKTVTVQLLGNVCEEQKMYEMIKNKASNVKIVIIIEWNMIENLKNISFVNTLLDDFCGNVNLHIVVTISSVSKLSNVKQVLPMVWKNIYINTYESWSDNELLPIAQSMLEQSIRFQSKGESELISKAAAAIHIKCYTCLPNDEGFIPSVHYLDFIKTLIQRKQITHRKIAINKENLKTCAVKYEETKQRVSELSIQLQDQRFQVTQIQQTCGNTILKLKNIKSEQGRLEQELDKKKKLLERQDEESKRIKEIINHDMAEPKSELKNIHMELNRITVEEFDKIRNLLRPPVNVDRIFELTLTVIGLEPTWNEAKKQMSHSIDFISKIRQTSPEKIDDAILQNLQANLAKSNYKVEDIEQNYATAAVFLSWLIKFEHYARVYKDYHPLQLQADSIQKDLEETYAALANHQHDLANFSLQQQVLQGQLQQREQQLEKAEQLMKTLESRIQLAQKLINQLSLTKEEWLIEIANFEAEEKCVNGDSLLVSAFRTYFGTFQYDGRRSCLNKIKTILNKEHLSFTECIDVPSIISPLSNSVGWINNGLSMDNFTIENFSLTMNNRMITAIFDPNEIFITWLRNFDGSKEISLSTLVKLENFYSNDKCEIFFSVEDQLIIPTKIVCLMKAKRQQESDASNCSNEVPSNRPKLIILYKKRSNVQVPASVSCVNNGNQLTGLKHILSVKLCNGISPEVVESIIKNKVELAEKRSHLQSQNQEVQRLIKLLDSSLLEDSILMENLQTASNKAIEIKKKCSDLEVGILKNEKLVLGHDKVSIPLANLFMLLEKMSQWKDTIRVNFEEFTNLVVGKLPRALSQPRWGTLLNQNTLLTSLTLICRYVPIPVHGTDRTAQEQVRIIVLLLSDFPL